MLVQRMKMQNLRISEFLIKPKIKSIALNVEVIPCFTLLKTELFTDRIRIVVSVLRQVFQKFSCSADLFHQFPPLTLTENPHLFQFEELFLPPRNFWKSSLAVQQNGRRSGDSSSTALGSLLLH